MDHETEQYILLLLADSNLPTGSFIASSGLESYFKHGFASLSPSPPESTLEFVKNSLHTYAHSALPFIADSHSQTSEVVNGELSDTVNKLKALDRLYECMTLNHVSRRASQAQGVALLTLYSKGFTKPPFLNLSESESEKSFKQLVDTFKKCVRKGETAGNLAICWGILTTALGVSLERAQYLHLFLHARSLLSSSVRLNAIGPYAAQQMLHHSVRSLVDETMTATAHLRTNIDLHSRDPEAAASLDGPSTTWPLGEIIAARHDMQQSRIFNS